jgi:Transposase DDE domain
MFSDATCQACGLRSQCTKGTRGRTISIQPEERLQQQARAHNQTETGQESLRERVVVEHRIARLVRLGARQSRYFGKTKTCFQVVMAAVVANLSLVVVFCYRKQKSAIHRTDPATQALSTPTDAQTAAQNGSLADTWISWIQDQYFLLQRTLFGLFANAASS